MDADSMKKLLWEMSCSSSPTYPGCSTTRALDRAFEIVVAEFLGDQRSAMEIITNVDRQNRTTRIAKCFALMYDVNIGNNYAILPCLELLQGFQGTKVSKAEGELLTMIEETILARFGKLNIDDDDEPHIEIASSH